MAPDTAEVLDRIEDEFSIIIADDEAGSLATVGEVCSFIWQRLDAPSACAMSRAFYRTRNAVADSLGLPRRSIKASTRLEPLLPRTTRIERWREIGRRSGLQFPPLEHAHRWRDAFMGMSMLAGAWPVAALWWSCYALGWLPGVLTWLFALPALVAWVVLTSRINRKLLIRTPRLVYEVPYKTAGELATAVVVLNFDAFGPDGPDGPPPSREAVWNRLVTVLCEALRLSPQDVVPGTRLAEDLGVRWAAPREGDWPAAQHPSGLRPSRPQA